MGSGGSVVGMLGTIMWLILWLCWVWGFLGLDGESAVGLGKV